MGRNNLEIGALPGRFAHLAKLQFLQVADTAMQQLRRGGRRAHAEIVFLHQGYPQAPQGSIVGQTGAGNAPTDNDYVERCLSEKLLEKLPGVIWTQGCVQNII